MRLQNKIILITGAGRGIGRAIAVGMAREGADVIINEIVESDEAANVATEIEQLGRRAMVMAADISQVAQIKAMFARVQQEFGRLDVLINNAGITGWTSLFETTEAQWDQVINTNLKGTFFASLAAAQIMREQITGGSIVNISSNCAALGVKNLVAYATSKGGIHAMTTQLAVELAPWKIRVNTFAPGPVNVERNLKDDPDYRTTWGQMVPLKRTAEPEEMTGPAIFLASDESAFMTGQLFYVDGGWTAQGKIPESHLDAVVRKHSSEKKET
jgi:NAD(P)-dependent dehydrogenase (short-subunit alcohol dehydrogenase family)